MFKNRKNNKKGFTLVEVIVVLVILAILAAIMIPALTGWIEKANKKTAIVEARSVLLALQTEVSENYTSGTTTTLTKDGSDIKVNGSAVTADFEKLVEIESAASKVTNPSLTGSKVTGFTYVSTDGYTVTYANKKFEVADKN